MNEKYECKLVKLYIYINCKLVKFVASLHPFFPVAIQKCNCCQKHDEGEVLFFCQINNVEKKFMTLYICETEAWIVLKIRVNESQEI